MEQRQADGQNPHSKLLWREGLFNLVYESVT